MPRRNAVPIEENQFEDDWVSVTSNRVTYRHYRELGYEVPPQPEIMTVRPWHLPKNSSTLVRIKCADCKETRTVEYSDASGVCRKCTAPKNRKKGRSWVGELNPKYNPNYTEAERMAVLDFSRVGEENKNWSYKVKELAGFECQCCGDNRGGNLVSHHLDSYSSSKERRLDLSNGICLCESCHIKFHRQYGYGNNTEQQFLQFQELKQWQ